MRTYRENPDGDENTTVTHDNERAVRAAKQALQPAKMCGNCAHWEGWSTMPRGRCALINIDIHRAACCSQWQERTASLRDNAHLFLKAADLLDLHAVELERAHTVNGCWPTDPDGADRRAERDWSDMIDTARALRRLATS
jgi:hypothetical protein